MNENKQDHADTVVFLVGLLDALIFALIPLGVLTAIVSAIRVSGPSWLKALIGRARENKAAVELELMSSTSHEVCELWNGAGLVRAFGKPKIREIVYLEDEAADKTSFGLHTLETLDISNDGKFRARGQFIFSAGNTSS